MRTRLLIMVAAAALLAGCGTTSEQAAGQVPSGTYEIVDNSGADVDTDRITLTFAPGTLAAATGCNTVSGRTGLDGGRLTVSDLNTTDLPCDEALVATQQWLTAFFEAQPTVTVDGNQLTLTTPQATIRLQPSALATAPASGPEPTAPRTA